MHYCYVYGGKRNLNFHGWLNNTTIKSLENEGCTVEVRDYEYQKSDDEDDFRSDNMPEKLVENSKFEPLM